MTRRGFRIITWNRMKMNFEHLGMQIISVRTPGDYWSNLYWTKNGNLWLAVHRTLSSSRHCQTISVKSILHRIIQKSRSKRLIIMFYAFHYSRKWWLKLSFWRHKTALAFIFNARVSTIWSAMKIDFFWDRIPEVICGDFNPLSNWMKISNSSTFKETHRITLKKYFLVGNVVFVAICKWINISFFIILTMDQFDFHGQVLCYHRTI